MVDDDETDFSSSHQLPSSHLPSHHTIYHHLTISSLTISSHQFIRKEPFFHGHDNYDQLVKISRVLGERIERRLRERLNENERDGWLVGDELLFILFIIFLFLFYHLQSTIYHLILFFSFF